MRYEGRSIMNAVIIHGPNLNMLGFRDAAVYGTGSYEDLKSYISDYALSRGISADFFQSNSEGAIIDRIQQAYLDSADAIIINAGAYSHYSYAIRDALEFCSCIKVEVHLSNVMEREDFRRKLVLSEVCDSTIYGRGFEGYKEAIDFILDKSHII